MICESSFLNSLRNYTPLLTIFSAFIISGSFFVNISAYRPVGLGLFFTGFIGIFWCPIDCGINMIKDEQIRLSLKLISVVIIAANLSILAAVLVVLITIVRNDSGELAALFTIFGSLIYISLPVVILGAILVITNFPQNLKLIIREIKHRRK